LRSIPFATASFPRAQRQRESNRNLDAALRVDARSALRLASMTIDTTRRGHHLCFEDCRRPRSPMPATVRNNAARNRYELEVDGHLAVAVYTLAPGVITFVHTEVPAELGGRGVGTMLVRGALEDVRRQGLKVVVRCSFIRAFMAKHPEFNDLLA
jgi:predicted GNAT family acetyltransferase